MAGKTLRNLGAPADLTYLLGLDWCHLFDRHKIEREDKGAFSEVPENLWARQNTMMMGVIPAYLLADLLMSEELRDKRKKEHQESVAQNAARAGADADSAKRPKRKHPTSRR